MCKSFVVGSNIRVLLFSGKVIVVGMIYEISLNCFVDVMIVQLSCFS